MSTTCISATRCTVALLTVLASAPASAASATRPTLVRFPNSDGSHIVFSAYDSLWSVANSGGRATRLTRDLGRRDMFPRYSPDGKWVAFTASHGTYSDVYVVPAGGGEARRLTFTSAKGASRGAVDNIVVTWTPNSKSIVFLSRHATWNGWTEQPNRVSVEGGLPTPLAVDRSGFLSFAPNGRAMAFNRVLRDFVPWKRYDGGQAQDVFTFDFDSKKLERITDWKGTDTVPMWAGRRIYFLSDRDEHRRLNLWVYDLDSRQNREVTHFSDFDIDIPSLGGNEITFQQGGKLWAMDLPSEKLRAVEVNVPEETAHTRVRTVRVASLIRETTGFQYASPIAHVDYALSPDGRLGAFSARGDIFALGAAPNTARNLTSTSGVDEDHPAFSPDGHKLAYITDHSGEQELAVRAAEGGPETIVTRFKAGYFYTPVWSPDGKTIALPDAWHKLWLVTLADGEPKCVASDPEQEIRDPAFSSDGRWLAYTTHRTTGMAAIHLYNISTGHDAIVSSPMDDDYSPVFAPDGRYLYFVSNRQGVQVVSESDRSFATAKSAGIYVATLEKDSASPLAPPAAGTPGNGPVEARSVHIDLKGLMQRVVPIPVPPSVISSLELRDNRIFYQTAPISLVEGSLPGENSEFHVYDLASHQDATIVTGLTSHALDASGTRVLYRKSRGWHLADAVVGAPHDSVFDMSALQADVNPPQEWREMFDNVWRLNRDLFVDASMNGINWHKVKDGFADFLPLLGTRDDLNYLIGQMQGELGSSHIRVAGGDEDLAPPLAEARLPGADLAFDAASSLFRFAKIYRGDNSRPDEASPLTEPGIALNDGTYLIEINGHRLQRMDNPYSLLSGLGDRIRLTVADTATGPRRDIVINGLTDESTLRQQDWIDHNREAVTQLSSGRVGYVYITDMGEDGAEQFARQYYPQLDKLGLVIDVRYNRGGFLSPFLLSRLYQRVDGIFVNREKGTEKLPRSAPPVPMVGLINEYSGSDAEIFANFFKNNGLGKLVGTRTAGAVRGVASSWLLLDGGSITVPFNALYGTRGNGLIENFGVSPNVEVQNDPAAVSTGVDAQLRAATELVLDQIRRSSPQSGVPDRELPASAGLGQVRRNSFVTEPPESQMRSRAN